MTGSAATDHGLTRRRFLAGLGVLGAAGAVGFRLPAARGGLLSPQPLFDPLRPLLQDLSRDTMGGLAAFVAPGRDPYSVAQGTTHQSPGGIDAGAHDFLLGALDSFYPVPDTYVRLVVQSLATGLADTGFALPRQLLAVPLDLARQLDDALLDLFGNDEAVPLSLPFSMLLNLVAVQVNPANLVGPFPASPFANASFADKVAVLDAIEDTDSDLVALVDSNLPQPVRESVSGLLKFAGAALVEFAGFGAYGEWAAYNGRTRELTGVPVMWPAVRYLEEVDFTPVEGWDELVDDPATGVPFHLGVSKATDAGVPPPIMKVPTGSTEGEAV